MKNLIFLLFSSLLLVGCSNSEETTNVADEIVGIKHEVAHAQEETQESGDAANTETESENGLNETNANEGNSMSLSGNNSTDDNTIRSNNNPSDEYSLSLSSTLNLTLDYIEALNKNNLEAIEGMLSSQASLDRASNEIQFVQGKETYSISLDDYHYPLEDFQFRGAGFGKNNDTFMIFFSFVGGEGDDNMYNIETEMTFIKENGEWKLQLMIS